MCKQWQTTQQQLLASCRIACWNLKHTNQQCILYKRAAERHKLAAILVQEDGTSHAARVALTHVCISGITLCHTCPSAGSEAASTCRITWRCRGGCRSLCTQLEKSELAAKRNQAPPLYHPARSQIACTHHRPPCLSQILRILGHSDETLCVDQTSWHGTLNIW